MSTESLSEKPKRARKDKGAAASQEAPLPELPVTPLESEAGELITGVMGLDLESGTKVDKTVTNSDFEATVAAVASKYQVSREHAAAGIFSTLQAGGTNNNKRSNVKISIGDISFESKVINQCITKCCKNITPRQFAKCFASTIFKVAVKFGITGNAYVYIRRNHSSFLTEDPSSFERFWCADFQIDNTSCPENIRNALRQRYADKFRRGLA